MDEWIDTCKWIYITHTSILVLGGGGGARPPNVPTEKNCNLYARASSSETYIIVRSQNTCAQTINAVPFY